MLQKIRDKASGALVIFMLGLLILAFAVWGIDFQGSANSNVLEVNGEEIPAYRVVNAYNQQVQSLQQYYPDGIPDLQQERIKDSVIESFVRSELLTQHAKKAGFAASDKAVWDGIRSSPNFQIDGQFNLDQFKFLAASNNFSADGLFNEFRKSSIIEQVAKGLSDSAFVTPAEVTQRGKLERESRTYRSMTISAGSLLPEANVDDAMIQAEYDLNQSDYFTEESVKVNYIEIDPAKISDSIEVTESTLRERYEAGLENKEFDQEQQRKARHILIAESDRSEDEARSLAADLRARILAGEDFAALASEYSDDAGSKVQGGELDWSTRDAFVGPFSDALFSMAEDDISEPIKSRYGFHVIKLEGVRGDAVKTFEEVRNTLTATLKTNLALDELNNIISDVDDAAYDNDENLTVAAEIAGVEIQESPWFSRIGGSGIAVNAEIRSAAFSGQILTDKLNSNSIKVGDKYYYLHLNEYRPSVQMPIDEVRARIRSKLAFELAGKLAEEKGLAAIEQLTSGGDLEQLAEESGATVEEVKSILRTDRSLPEPVTKAIFAAATPADQSVFTGAVLANGDYQVFEVQKVEVGAPLDGAQKDALAQAMANMELAAYVSTLRSKADIESRPELLSQ